MCHGTLTCTPQVNILESMLPFRVPFPKGKVDRRLRRQVWEAAIGLSKREGIKFAKLDHLCADVCVCVSVCLSVSTPTLFPDASVSLESACCQQIRFFETKEKMNTEMACVFLLS